MQQRKLFAGVQRNQVEPPVMDIRKIFLLAMLGGISVMFLGLTASLLYARLIDGNPPIHLPLIFHANTALILVSSVSFHFANQALKKEDDQQYLQALAVTFVLGVLFLGFQVLGWRELSASGISFVGGRGNTGTYLYFISGFHALHVLGGLFFMGYYLVKAIRRSYDPVKQLIHSTDPNRTRPLGLMAIYWHFVDGLWLYLYLFFLVSSII